MNRVYHCGQNPQETCWPGTYGALEPPCEGCKLNKKKGEAKQSQEAK